MRSSTSTRSAISRDEIVAAARRMVGVRYRRHGRTEHGLDCGGLLYAVAKAIGLPQDDLPVSERSWPDGFLLRHLGLRGRERLPPYHLANGAVGVFLDGGKARHAGVIAGPPWSLIHADAKARKVVEVPYDLWRQRLITAFDFPNLSDP